VSRWLRLYESALDDPKVQRLAPDVFKAWVNMLCLASRGGGKLPGVDDIAFALRVTRDVARDWVVTLRDMGLIDVNSDDGSMFPHNWNGRQFRSDADPTSTERQRRKRERDAADKMQKNVTRDVTPTRTEQSRADSTYKLTAQRETLSVPATPKTDPSGVLVSFPGSEQPNAEAKRKPKRNEYPPGFVKFWSDYPTDPIMSKVRAFQSWNKLNRADKEAAIASMPGFKAYCRATKDYRPVHAERYLSQKRWEAAAESTARATAAAGVYVRVGTQAWRAWEAEYRQLGKGSPITDKAGNGWYFPTEFPHSDFRGEVAQ
jgi:hypothetical protein